MYRLIALVLGYLLGGIQSAILYSRLKGMDIRNHGSGNAGATNVMRVMGKKAALIVFVGDILKAVIAVIIAKVIFPEAALLAALYAGIGAIIGHNYPVFFGFKGGKGIAVTVGAIYFIDIRIGLIATIIFFISAFITKIVSVSSILLATSVPVQIYFFYREEYFVIEAICLGVFIAAMAIYRHKSNIKRLLEGTESKLGQKNK